MFNNATENLDEELIISQLADMNAAFNRENSDTINTREIFLPVAGSARIRFVLASKDPSGNSTNGIHRVRTNLSTFGSGSASQTLNADRVKFSSLGGTDAWNTDKYLNIWICDISFGGRIGLLGYAFPPVNADFWQPRSFERCKS